MIRVGLRTALVLALVSCGKTDAPADRATGAAHPPPATPRIEKDPAKAKALIASGATVIDVRSADEFADDHLATATNIPVEDFAARIAEVDELVGGDKAKPVVLHCAAGRRAQTAKAQLEAGGYTNVVNGGGLRDLKAP